MTGVAKLAADCREEYKTLLQSFSRMNNRTPRCSRLAQEIFEATYRKDRLADLMLLQKGLYCVERDGQTACKITGIIGKLPIFSMMPKSLPTFAGALLQHCDLATVLALRLSCMSWGKSVGIEDLFLTALSDTRNPKPWENILITLDAYDKTKPRLLELLQVFFAQASEQQQERFFRLELRILQHRNIGQLASILPPSLKFLSFGVKGQRVIQLIQTIRDMPNPPRIHTMTVWRYFTGEHQPSLNAVRAVFSLKPNCLNVESRIFLQDWLTLVPRDNLEEMSASVHTLKIINFIHDHYIVDLKAQSIKLPCLPSVQSLCLEGVCFDPMMLCVPALSQAFPNLTTLVIREGHINNSPLDHSTKLQILMTAFPALHELQVFFSLSFFTIPTLRQVCSLMGNSALMKLKFNFHLQKLAERRHLEIIHGTCKALHGVEMRYQLMTQKAEEVITIELSRIKRPSDADTENARESKKYRPELVIREERDNMTS